MQGGVNLERILRDPARFASYCKTDVTRLTSSSKILQDKHLVTRISQEHPVSARGIRDCLGQGYSRLSRPGVFETISARGIHKSSLEHFNERVFPIWTNGRQNIVYIQRQIFNFVFRQIENSVNLKIWRDQCFWSWNFFHNLLTFTGLLYERISFDDFDNNLQDLLQIIDINNFNLSKFKFMRCMLSIHSDQVHNFQAKEHLTQNSMTIWKIWAQHYRTSLRGWWYWSITKNGINSGLIFWQFGRSFRAGNRLGNNSIENSCCYWDVCELMDRNQTAIDTNNAKN